MLRVGSITTVNSPAGPDAVAQRRQTRRDRFRNRRLDHTTSPRLIRQCRHVRSAHRQIDPQCCQCLSSVVVDVDPEGGPAERDIPNIRANRAPATTGPEFLNRATTLDAERPAQPVRS